MRRPPSQRQRAGPHPGPAQHHRLARLAVVNVDDVWGRKLLRQLAIPAETFSLDDVRRWGGELRREGLLPWKESEKFQALVAGKIDAIFDEASDVWLNEAVEAGMTILPLSEQTVVVLGTQAASIVLPRLARQLAALRAQREEVAKEVERLVLAHPLHPVLTSMPGVGVRTAARLLIDVATRAFASAAHLAAYAGLAPVTRRSGSSIRGELPSRRGNKQLKRAMFLSAFAALRDPISRAYYTRKISQGKRHNQALIALARRRCDVLFAMLRDGTLYCPPRPEISLTTT